MRRDLVSDGKLKICHLKSLNASDYKLPKSLKSEICNLQSEFLLAAYFSFGFGDFQHRFENGVGVQAD
jgi:hypothetical protein